MMIRQPIVAGRFYPADAASCRPWLQALPLANPPAAQTRLIGQLDLLNRYALPPARRLELMELLRKPAGFVQTECARRFSGRGISTSAPAPASIQPQTDSGLPDRERRRQVPEEEAGTAAREELAMDRAGPRMALPILRFFRAAPARLRACHTAGEEAGE